MVNCECTINFVRLGRNRGSVGGRGHRGQSRSERSVNRYFFELSVYVKEGGKGRGTLFAIEPN